MKNISSSPRTITFCLEQFRKILHISLKFVHFWQWNWKNCSYFVTFWILTYFVKFIGTKLFGVGCWNFGVMFFKHIFMAEIQDFLWFHFFSCSWYFWATINTTNHENLCSGCTSGWFWKIWNSTYFVKFIEKKLFEAGCWNFASMFFKHISMAETQHFLWFSFFR